LGNRNNKESQPDEKGDELADTESTSNNDKPTMVTDDDLPADVVNSDNNIDDVNLTKHKSATNIITEATAD